MGIIHSAEIPNYITAASPLGLRRAMYITNSKAGKQFQYFDIQSYVETNGKTVWIAWFYNNIEGIDQLNDNAQQLQG